MKQRKGIQRQKMSAGYDTPYNTDVCSPLNTTICHSAAISGGVSIWLEKINKESMKTTTKTLIICILLMPSLVLAMTLEEYADNLDTSYYDGTINITAFSDKMMDTDSNSQNDTLIFNLTTDFTETGVFTANLFFKNASIPILSQTKTISASNPSFYLNISTFYLSEPQYAYVARIYNEIGQIVFESNRHNTSVYSNFETGTSVTDVSDANAGNNFIRIALDLDVMRNETVNVSVSLKFNDSIISGTKEITLTTPSQTVNVDIDNETIKSTHYNGTYNISSIIIGNKIQNYEYTTAAYDFEDFAKTSYIQSFSVGLIDTDSNNLSEYLEVNATLDIVTEGTYNLMGDLRDPEGNYVATINKTEYLTAGLQVLQIDLNGSEIYKTYHSGPYEISFMKLSLSGTQKDIVYAPYLTQEYHYADFEPPSLPELDVSIGKVFDEINNLSNVEVNITNNGQIPAFNIFVDIFDNNTYDNRSAIVSLNGSRSVTQNYVIQNSSNDSIITAIVDFSNLVDESDETNNIVQITNFQEQISLSIPSIGTVYSNFTRKIYEMTIENDGNTEVTDISWRFDTGEENLSSNANVSSLAAGRTIFAYLDYNYSAEGTYQIMANATGYRQSEQVSALFSTLVESGALVITNFNASLAGGNVVIFEAEAANNLEENINDMGWSLNTEESMIASMQAVDLGQNKSILIFAAHNYSSLSTYNPTLTVNNSEHSDSESIEISLTNLRILGFAVASANQTGHIFELIMGNTGENAYELVEWTLDTGDSLTIQSNTNTTIQSNEQVFVYINHNFTGTGTYSLNATVRNGTIYDTELSSLEIT